MSNKDLEAKIQILFAGGGKQDALEFLRLYCEYCSLIDDEVDEEKDTKRIRQIAWMAGCVFNCNYWKKWSSVLYMVDRLCHNTYFDSVVMEQSNEEWKRQHAIIYSHTAMNMTLAVILLEFGQHEFESWSLVIREAAHNRELEPTTNNGHICETVRYQENSSSETKSTVKHLLGEDILTKGTDSD